MREDGENSAPEDASVVTVGTYDGVHLGHQQLVHDSVACARRLGVPALVVTFDRLPAEVVRPQATPKLLTGLEHKLELLASTGADEVAVLRFDEHRANEPAESFVVDYLVGELGAKAIFVGRNFRFGHGAKGDFSLIERLGEELGFSAHALDLVIDNEGMAVSSTRIRTHIAAGELDEAAHLLGRPHELRGTLLPSGRGFVVSGCFAMPPAGSYTVHVGPPGAPGERMTAVFEEVSGNAAEVVVTFKSSRAQGAEPAGSAVAVRFG